MVRKVNRRTSGADGETAALRGIEQDFVLEIGGIVDSGNFTETGCDVSKRGFFPHPIPPGAMDSLKEGYTSKRAPAPPAISSAIGPAAVPSGSAWCDGARACVVCAKMDGCQLKPLSSQCAVPMASATCFADNTREIRSAGVGCAVRGL